MGEAEALDVRVAVVVAAAAVAIRRSRVGAPLDHAEGDRRAGEVVAAAEGVVAGPGAGENVHVVGQARAPGDRNEEGEGGERCRGGDTCTSDQGVNVTALA